MLIKDVFLGLSVKQFLTCNQECHPARDVTVKRPSEIQVCRIHRVPFVNKISSVKEVYLTALLQNQKDWYK